jgi:hypothetical protein
MLKCKNFVPTLIMHFGFWEEILEKWSMKGHLTREEADNAIAYGETK